MNKYSLRQGLPVIQEGSNIHIGLAPPNAVLIEDAPNGLSELLGFASVPRGESELVEYSTQLGFNEEESHDLVNELIDAKIITSKWIDRESRYSRHDLFYELSNDERDYSSLDLASCRVGLVGVGGIGTNIAMQLAAAGVGTLTLMDDDTVELSNLTRQFLFNESDIGQQKISTARRRLSEKNSSVRVDLIARSADGSESLRQIFQSSDIVIISADTPQTITEWSNTISLETGVPFISTGYQDTRGLVGPLIMPGDGPCFVCAIKSDGLNSDVVSEQAADIENLNLSYQAPSFGPLNSIVASFAVADTLRLLSGLGSNLAGRRLVIDALTYEASFEIYERFDNCRACGEADKSSHVSVK